MKSYEDVLSAIDTNDLKDQIVRWIRDWFCENGDGCNAIIGISGGKDSSVVAALCVEALGRERVVGVLMPNGIQNDIEDSFKLVKHLGINYIVTNIGQAYNGVINSLCNIFIQNDNGYYEQETFNVSNQTLVNLPARIRMATLYAVAQSYNGRVANTCNLSEDWVGYSTRYGDSVGDFSPLSNLTTDEVIMVGFTCGLPRELVVKKPSDGLCGKTDEDNLGFTYRQLNEYIRTGVCEDQEIKNLIDKKHKMNQFKLSTMQSFLFKPDYENL